MESMPEMVVETPRDRNGTFEPKILRKHQTRFEGFDAKIVSLYARGMTTRDIQAHLEQMYGVEVSAALISEVTDAVTDEVKVWQSRPLEALYPILYLDALYVKMRHEGRIRTGRSTWRSGWIWTDAKRCWDCGRMPAKARSSG